MAGYFSQFLCEANDRYSIIIEDDGRVAYAYLYKDDEITGDIWLYNQGEAPVRYNTSRMLPYLNAAGFIEKNIEPITSDDEVQILWFLNEDGKAEAIIYVRDELVAKMIDGSKPGWSAMVKKDGPLAKVLIKK